MESRVVIKDIEWNITRHGTLNPVIIFDDDNLSKIKTDIFTVKTYKLNIGDEVIVSKESKGFPKIINNLSSSFKATIPERCPICNGRTEVIGNELHCMHKTCSGKRAKIITYFCGEDGLNILGVSNATITKLVNKGYIRYVYDLYDLKNSKISLNRFLGKSTCKKVLDAIDKSKDTTLDRLISALGITGLHSAKLISDYCKNDVNTFLSLSLSEFDWTSIPGIGEKVSDAVNFYMLNNYELFKRISRCLYIEPIVDKKYNNGNLFGLRFYVAGSFSTFRNRGDILEYIDAYGGKVIGNINSTLDYVVNNNNSKDIIINKKAKQLEIPVINEFQLREMVMKVE